MLNTITKTFPRKGKLVEFIREQLEMNGKLYHGLVWIDCILVIKSYTTRTKKLIDFYLEIK